MREFFVIANFYDVSFIQNYDLIRILYRTESMCHNYNGTSIDDIKTDNAMKNFFIIFLGFIFLWVQR